MLAATRAHQQPMTECDVSRSSYAGHVFLWLVVFAIVFVGRRVGAIPFPHLAFLVMSGIYFFGALWIVRQRHGDAGLFARLASVALIATWAVAVGLYLMPDSYPYSFASRPGWYVEMMDVLFYIYAGCPPLLLLLGGTLPAAWKTSPQDPSGARM